MTPEKPTSHVPKMFQKRRPPTGAPPGTLAISRTSAKPTIQVIDYDVDHVSTEAVTEVSSLRALLDGKGVAWIDIQGLGDEAVMREIGAIFSVHPLALEDVVNVPQRPKFEEYPGNQMLWITRMAQLVDSKLELEQVGLIVGPNYVLSFQETAARDVLEPVRARVRAGKGLIRRAGSAYLAYAILDTIIDAYYPVIEDITARLERLETEVVDEPAAWMVKELNLVKAELVIMRRAVWPEQEALTRELRGDGGLIPDEVRLYLRDTHDHCTQLVDVIDSQRELVNGLLNTYLSLMSNRTNEVMKLLTIIATIFIPLTFVVGVYGMNFTNMPEIHSSWGYPVVLGIMTVIGAGMLLWFRRKGWLGGRRERDRER